MTHTGSFKGFEKGFRQLRQVDVEQATADLWKALGINNRSAFRLYRKGLREMKVSQAANVREVFRSYGIPVTNIWGNE